MHPRDAAHQLIEMRLDHLDYYQVVMTEPILSLADVLSGEIEELTGERESETRDLHLLSLEGDREQVWELGQLMLQSLALLMRSAIESFPKLAISWGRQHTRKQLKILNWGTMHAYFRGVGHPLCQMAGYCKTDTLNQICNRVKHHDGKATPILAQRGYATDAEAKIMLTGDQIVEFLSASREFLKAAVTEAPYLAPDASQ